MPQDDLLSEAVIRYYGYGVLATPRLHPEAVVKLVGEEKAIELVQRVEALESEMTQDPEVLWNADPKRGAKQAAMFADRHPELSPAAIKALEWVYFHTWR